MSASRYVVFFPRQVSAHLGNVLAVISDRRVYTVTGSLTNTVAGINATTPGTSFLTNIGYAIPDILAINDYYPFGEPFGELMPGRNTNAQDYKYGFSGQEKDDEINGSVGTAYSFENRVLDTRLGKWLSVDGEAEEYPSISTYAYTGNDPIGNQEKDGNVFETAWDVANVVMDVASLAGNLAVGNYGAAAVDAAGLVVDAAATLIPGVPGGAGAAIKAVRAGAKVADKVNSSLCVVFRRVTTHH